MQSPTLFIAIFPLIHLHLALSVTGDGSAHIGTLLAIHAKIGITTELRKMILDKYFSVPRSFRDIRKKLHSLDLDVRSASLNTVLSKMVERQELARLGTRGAYLYQHMGPKGFHK